MKYVLGIDFGGGSSKATLLSQDGDTVATSSSEYPTLYPQPGFVEQNPDDWYDATRKNVKDIIAKTGVNPKEIVAIGLDAATHTAVLTDENYNVVCPSIYWTDTRSVKQVEFLRQNYKSDIEKIALHSPGTIWTLPQLMWIKENEPQTFSKIKKIMFAKDYVRHCLTGDHCTDYIEAEGSMLFDFETMDWSDKLCSILGIDKSYLPEIKRPTDIVGTLTSKAATDLGLCEGTQVICGTTDTAMEVLASGAVQKGDMTVKLATAGRICIITDKFFPDEHIVNYSHISEGLCYPGTATKACASSYRWFRDTFNGDYRELDKQAEKVPIGSEGLMYHPYLNGELTPYGDPELCASFTGVRAGHTMGHFARSVLEGVAMSLLDSKNYLLSKGIELSDKASIIGGGSKSPLWRQIVADTLGITLVENENSDSSLGSAIIAAVAAGIFEDCASAVGKCIKPVSVTKPIAENTAKYDKMYKKYKATANALQKIYHEEY